MLLTHIIILLEMGINRTPPYSLPLFLLFNVLNNILYIVSPPRFKYKLYVDVLDIIVANAALTGGGVYLTFVHLPHTQQQKQMIPQYFNNVCTVPVWRTHAL